MIVVDASVLLVALADQLPGGAAARSRLRGEALAAPSLIDLEVLSALRRLCRSGALSSRRAEEVVGDLAALPIRRAVPRRLLGRIWELRDSVSAYDAAYVALAEALGATLLTADGRLAAAHGPRCPIEVLEAPAP